MKSLPIMALLTALAAGLSAAELNPELLGRLDFFLNYGIAEHLELLEGESELAVSPQRFQVCKASGAVAGFNLECSSVAVSTQGAQVSAPAVKGGVK